MSFIGAVPQHGIHDDRQPPGEGVRPCLAHRGSPGDRECPVLQLQRSLVARQNDVCSPVREGANSPIAASRCCGYNRSRLTGGSRHQAEISADVAGSSEATGIINCCCESESRELADTGDAHQVLAGAAFHPTSVSTLTWTRFATSVWRSMGWPGAEIEIVRA